MSRTYRTDQLQPGLLNINQASARLGIAPTTAYDWIAAGIFPVRVFKIGKRWKVTVAELERFLAGEPAHQPAERESA